jgi:hypothetical protein
MANDHSSLRIALTGFALNLIDIFDQVLLPALREYFQCCVMESVLLLLLLLLLPVMSVRQMEMSGRHTDSSSSLSTGGSPGRPKLDEVPLRQNPQQAISV